MGALPKKKISKGRKNRRRSHQALVVERGSVCPKCGNVKRSHFECAYCGNYKSTKK